MKKDKEDLTKKQRYYQNNREQVLAYQNNRYREAHAVFQNWRKTLKCCMCGQDDVVCLEFHHSDPSLKEQNVVRMIARSARSVIKELKKCVVVCANCHRKIHGYDLITDPGIIDLANSFESFVNKQKLIDTK